MALYFNDRIPDPIHGENTRYYDAVGDDGNIKLPDFKLVMKNNIPPDKTGDPVSAGNLNYASGNSLFPALHKKDIKVGNCVTFAANEYAVPVMKGIARPIAVTGLERGVSHFTNGFFRISDNRLLLVYANQMGLMSVDFATRTAAVVGTNALFNLQSGETFWDGTLVRSLDNDSVAVFCYILNHTGTTLTNELLYILAE